jgi:hypothetical protein
MQQIEKALGKPITRVETDNVDVMEEVSYASRISLLVMTAVLQTFKKALKDAK